MRQTRWLRATSATRPLVHRKWTRCLTPTRGTPQLSKYRGKKCAKRARRYARPKCTSIATEPEAWRQKSKRHCANYANHRHEPPSQWHLPPPRAPNSPERQAQARRKQGTELGGRYLRAPCAPGLSQRMPGPQMSITHAATSTICAASRGSDHPGQL